MVRSDGGPRIVPVPRLRRTPNATGLPARGSTSREAAVRVATLPVMSGQEDETLTAALRRLADEHASGLLSIAVPGGEIVIELAAGTPVTIGPARDVTGRVGDDAPRGLVTAAVVDDLVDRTVAAVVAGDVEWAWGVDSSAERVSVPSGFVPELSRRAVDAAEALAAVGPDAVLDAAHAVPTSGELDGVRELFDGDRTLADVAEAAALPLPTVAAMAASMVAGGALAVVPEVDEDEPTASWSDAVAAAEVEDEEDEPELWVMEPIEDEQGRDATDEGDDDAPGDVEPAASRTTPAADDEDPEDWNDTTWLDELSPIDDDSLPALATGEDDVATRAEIGSMLSELQDDEPRRRGRTDERVSAEPSDDPADDVVRDEPAHAEPAPRREPKAEPGEVAEFLRELSRLALDDD